MLSLQIILKEVLAFVRDTERKYMLEIILPSAS